MYTSKYIIGIDEVGRGPIAGPVVIGAVKLPVISHMAQVVGLGLKDSKQLSEKDRGKWFTRIKELQNTGELAYAVSFVRNTVIDKKGIAYALRLATKRTLDKLNADGHTTQVLLDGGLTAPESFVHQETIIKGDEKELAIALASIVAKVLRDQYMVRMAQQFPQYGFEAHKGYGTQTHRNMIKKYGLSPLHRKTFCQNFI